MLIPERVVSRPVGDVDGATQTPFPQMGPFETTSLPPWSLDTSTERVETVKCFLRHSGFSAKVASFLAHAERPSTTLDYQHTWKRYSRR
ncbi:hypothetical protein E2C01_052495 [Portunus trituberculatus]|uniref:Uncharacterized protein n=1 Tax=Portunus trituberculatus TaxID=210409 RepID=A0A5B7GLQ1_PORTR|nr:hypothetical protein [Portunus trituberculatus]